MMTRPSESDTNKAPFFITLVENVGPLKDVPMCSTEDEDIKRIVAACRELATKKALLEFPDSAKKQQCRRKKGPQFPDCRHIETYAGEMPSSESDHVRLTLEAVIQSLQNLEGEQMNFKNVTHILISRWGRWDYRSHVRDHQVASIVLQLREGRPIGDLLKELDGLSCDVQRLRARNTSNLEGGEYIGPSEDTPSRSLEDEDKDY